MTRDARIVVMHLITGLGAGGAERNLARLAENIDQTRFRTIVVSLMGEGPVAKQLRHANVEVLALNVRRARDLPLGVAYFEYLLLSRRPDILQTWLYHSDLLGLLAGKTASVPSVIWNIRCSVVAEGWPQSLAQALPHVLARLSRFPEATVVNSETGRRVHENYGYRCRDWRVIPNGFDTAAFRPLSGHRKGMRESLGIPANAMVVGMLARFHSDKDHNTFLEAASLTRKSLKDVHFVLAGSGVAEGSDLGLRVARLGLTHCVHLLGERTDIPELLSAFDLSTLSSWTEGFPNAIGESMSCAVPCVVTDVGDSSLLVGTTGVVVPARDPRALSDGWLRLLLMSDDERCGLGESARRRIVETFRLERAVCRYQDLYEDIYARRRRRLRPPRQHAWLAATRQRW